ncbi:CNH domain-containing protein [Caenorhabditis elegans]|uniref:CNH domain-containing protein n=1 Tax=Caenorhabditis elegans TaxID=6239 RepID=Q19104_CAEEL|nr:CNH domain-containing protein [Caenorhabditis elegans]CAA92765.2 CNH domain-containing protein [Caenorhabditis elegans]|eukprot:NP_001255539.1 Uncharacterized protein CELE_F01G4.4 [Caenorhabditis elegans]
MYSGARQGVISGKVTHHNEVFYEFFDKDYKYLFGKVKDIFTDVGAWVEYNVEKVQSHPKNCLHFAQNVNTEVKRTNAPTCDVFSSNRFQFDVREFNKVDFFQFDNADRQLSFKGTIRFNSNKNQFYHEYYGDVLVGEAEKLIRFGINEIDVMMNLYRSDEYTRGPHWYVKHYINKGKSYNINGYLSINGFVLRGPGGVVRNKNQVNIPPDALRPNNPVPNLSNGTSSQELAAAPNRNNFPTYATQRPRRNSDWDDEEPQTTAAPAGTSNSTAAASRPQVGDGKTGFRAFGGDAAPQSRGFDDGAIQRRAFGGLTTAPAAAPNRNNFPTYATQRPRRNSDWDDEDPQTTAAPAGTFNSAAASFRPQVGNGKAGSRAFGGDTAPQRSGLDDGATQRRAFEGLTIAPAAASNRNSFPTFATQRPRRNSDWGDEEPETTVAPAGKSNSTAAASRPQVGNGKTGSRPFGGDTAPQRRGLDDGAIQRRAFGGLTTAPAAAPNQNNFPTFATQRPRRNSDWDDEEPQATDAPAGTFNSAAASFRPQVGNGKAGSRAFGGDTAPQTSGLDDGAIERRAFGALATAPREVVLGGERAAGQLRPRGPESTIQPRRVPQSRQFGGVSATSNDPTTPEPRRINETPRVLLPPQSKGRRVDS